MSAPRDQWNPTSLPSQAGRVFLVTGSNAGLGYFASEQLARAGAHVVMSGRNPNRLAAARAAIGRRVPDASVETLLLDTSNLGSVRAAAASVGGREIARISLGEGRQVHGEVRPVHVGGRDRVVHRDPDLAVRQLGPAAAVNLRNPRHRLGEGLERQDGRIQRPHRPGRQRQREEVDDGGSEDLVQDD